MLGGVPTIPDVYSFTIRATDAGNPAIFADHPFTYRVSPIQVVSPRKTRLATAIAAIAFGHPV